MKKLLALLLCVAMLIPMFAACTNGDSTIEETTESQVQQKPNNKPEPEPEKVPDPLLIEHLADYTIIYPEVNTSSEMLAAIRDFRDAVNTKLEVKLDIKDDFVNDKNPIGAREILIGKTNRPESAIAYEKAPRINDYALQIVDEKLVIAASTDEMIILLLEMVTTKINELSSHHDAFFTAEMQTVFTDSYEIEAVTIDGNDLGGYTIVCPNTNATVAMAEMLIDAIAEKYQYKLAYTLEQHVETPEKAILFGNTKFGLPEGVYGVESNQYYFGMVNGTLYVYAADETVLYKTIDKLVSQTVDSATNTVSLDLTDVIETPAATTLTTMSFNLWVSSITDARANRVIERINLVKPDTLGVQEANSDWVKRLKNALKDEYEYIGVGRDANNEGEHSGIFYRKDTLRVIESGTKWMSATPDVVSKYPESAYNRVFTYALFERISDGERFVHVNAHTDHTGSAGGVRLKQLKVLVNFVKANYADLPVVITGDLNATESTAEIQHVLNSGWDNSAKIAHKTTNAATFTPNGSIIDFCLTSQNDFFVYEYAVDSYKYNGEQKDPSDHCPIYIKFDLK